MVRGAPTTVAVPLDRQSKWYVRDLTGRATTLPLLNSEPGTRTVTRNNVDQFSHSIVSLGRVWAVFKQVVVSVSICPKRSAMIRMRAIGQIEVLGFVVKDIWRALFCSFLMKICEYGMLHD
jgi:hypothetical protein